MNYYLLQYIMPDPEVPCELKFLSQLGDDAALYGLFYPGFGNCISWCYLTIAKNVIIATHLDTNGGTSITNKWDKKFVQELKELPAIKALKNPRWFEHYNHAIDDENGGPTLDEVFLTAEGRIKWEPIAHYDRFYDPPSKDPLCVAAAFESLTGVPVPDFAATEFEQYMNA